MSATHVVRAGECMASIAAKYGHSKWETIYHHAENDTLREQRCDPYVLQPGDVVHVPDVETFSTSCATAQRHRFELKSPSTRFTLKLRDLDGSALSQRKWRLRLGSREIDGTTDGNGKLEAQISANATTATLLVWLTDDAEQNPDNALHLSLDLGDLDPHDTLRGAQSRLHNHGYPCEPTGRLDDATRTALAAFQRDQSLDVTGELDDATASKLRDLHDPE